MLGHASAATRLFHYSALAHIFDADIEMLLITALRNTEDMTLNILMGF